MESQDCQTVKERFYKMVKDDNCSNGAEDVPEAFEEARQALKQAEVELGQARELDADSDEAGHAFQFEAGHRFRSEAGRHSDLKPATQRSLPRIEAIMFRRCG